MTMLMKGNQLAAELRAEVARKVNHWKARGVTPRMAALIVDGDPASMYYAESKAKLADKVGVQFDLIQFPCDVNEQQLIDVIQGLNQDPAVHGIMVELPLPEHMSVKRVIKQISPLKDVDGLTPANRLAVVTGGAGLYPATPVACIRLLKYYGHGLEGKNVVVIGRGQTVGLPLLHLLLRENATVTVCHSKTRNLSEHLKHADIAFVAVGRPNLIQPDMVTQHLVVVDAGINELPDGEIVGDVSPDVLVHVTAMSPTPGGVGTVTTVQLFENLMAAVELQHASTEQHTRR